MTTSQNTAELLWDSNYAKTETAIVYNIKLRVSSKRGEKV